MRLKYYLGIDVAKHRHPGAIVDAEGNLVSAASLFPTPGTGFKG